MNNDSNTLGVFIIFRGSGNDEHDNTGTKILLLQVQLKK